MRLILAPSPCPLDREDGTVVCLACGERWPAAEVADKLPACPTWAAVAAVEDAGEPVATPAPLAGWRAGVVLAGDVVALVTLGAVFGALVALAGLMLDAASAMQRGANRVSRCWGAAGAWLRRAVRP